MLKGVVVASAWSSASRARLRRRTGRSQDRSRTSGKPGSARPFRSTARGT